MSQFKNWPMLRGLPVGDLHSHRCDTCGFLWQHSTSQVARMDAAGKARAHLCQNCGASQRWIADERREAKDEPAAKNTELWRAGLDPEPRFAAVWSNWEQESIETYPSIDRHRPIGATWDAIERMAAQAAANNP